MSKVLTETTHAPVPQAGTLKLQPIKDEELKREALEKMKFRATGLLVAAAVVNVIARILEVRWPGFGYLRATAEAAMVGGLADWFAVTALFRYPMGIKIPHTAIVPNRKDRIGRSLGSFVQNNFLSPPVISMRLKHAQIARKLADWLSDPAHAEVVGRHAAAAVSGVMQVLRDEEVQEVIEDTVVRRVRETQVAPLMGNVLSLVTAENRHQELLNAALRLIDRLVDENRDALRQRIRAELPWWVPSPIDEKIYQKIINGVDHTLDEVASDPNHPLRARFNEAVAEFIERLKSSPELIERGEHIKEEVLEHPAVRGYSASLWTDLKASVLRHAADPGSEFRGRIAHTVNRFAESLREDEELLAKIDGWIEGAVLYFVEQYRGEVAELISSTVQAWDPEDTTRKIELQIGKDLQFIRINGTLVGGLAGLLIYAISQFFAG
ncbi:MAG TPA: DUF445 domain-containing protein [Longimicrobium sp.]|jgi:uncharacterized membrane-anchored protein YjiN (DUF445 family)